MVNFRVGDRVEVVNINGSVLEKGDIGVISILEGTVAKVRVNNRPTWGNWISVLDLKLLPTDDQRIESLEKRIEMVDGIIRDVRSDNYHEIEAMKKEIAELRKAMESYFKVPVEPSTDIKEDKPTKTPNQLRAEIIAKAKGFVEWTKKSHTGRATKGPLKGQIVTWNDVYVRNKDLFSSSVCHAEFIVNKDKRTIVALLRGADTNEIYYRGIAICNPSDVFNEHIGKAIALGRALGLDVSEFEGAVQPTEIVKGMYCKHYIPGYEGKVNYFDGKYWRSDGNIDGSHPVNLTIINDTNAIYGEVE